MVIWKYSWKGQSHQNPLMEWIQLMLYIVHSTFMTAPQKNTYNSMASGHLHRFGCAYVGTHVSYS